MGKYEFKIDANVLNHLGIGLYSRIPAVLSEAVANSYDADANEVLININCEKDIIEIKDDGCGMSLKDINEHFLRVGYQKRKDIEKTPKYQRKPMGRKGIGKLSLFSIANIIKVYSFSGEQKEGFLINVQSLKKAIDSKESYEPEEITPDIETIGTKIVLNEIRKNKTLSNIESVKKELSRRFNVFDTNFKIFVNDSPLTYKDRKYFDKVEKIFLYGNVSEDSIKECKNLKYEPVIRENKINDKLIINGWIGYVDSTSDLTEDDDNINKISLFARGKLGQEDILSSIKTSTNYNQYLIGEINTDFFDEIEDMALTNREGYNKETPEYNLLKDFLKEEIKYIGSDWNKVKADEGYNSAKNTIPEIENWFITLKNDDRKIAKQLFGKINQIGHMEVEQKKIVLANTVLAFEKAKFNGELEKLKELDCNDFDKLGAVISGFQDIESMYYYQIVNGKINIINKLEEIITAAQKEKFIQEHLFKHLWILDPTWDEITNDAVMEKNVFNALGIEKDKGKDKKNYGRIDIKLKTSSSKYVIIELKRGNRILKYGELQEQIGKYYRGMNDVLVKQGQIHKYFEIIVVVGKFIEDNSTYEQTTVANALKPLNARVVHYDELISNSLKIYKDYLEIKKNHATILPIMKYLEDNEKDKSL